MDSCCKKTKLTKTYWSIYKSGLSKSVQKYHTELGRQTLCHSIFKTSNTLLKAHDIIQIDKDFQGRRADEIQRYMERLFGVFNLGSDRTKPIIQFLPLKYSREVREAHKISQAARHREITITHNPNITKEMNCLRLL